MLPAPFSFSLLIPRNKINSHRISLNLYACIVALWAPCFAQAPSYTTFRKMTIINSASRQGFPTDPYPSSAAAMHAKTRLTMTKRPSARSVPAVFAMG